VVDGSLPQGRLERDAGTVGKGSGQDLGIRIWWSVLGEDCALR
jgi:hypothetical protein